jgi:hypothetical protein
VLAKLLKQLWTEQHIAVFVARVILRFYQSSDTGFQNSSDERLIHGPRSRRR